MAYSLPTSVLSYDVVGPLRVRINLFAEDFSSPADELTHEYVIQELSTARTSGDKTREASALLSEAEFYRRRSYFVGTKNLDKAMQSAKDALAIFREVGDPRLQGTAQLELASLHGLLGNSKSMLEAAEEALTVFKEFGDTKNVAKSIHRIAASYALLDNYGRAVKKAKEATELYRQLGDVAQQAFELAAVAQWNLMWQRPLKALRAAEASMELAAKVEDSAGAAAEAGGGTAAEEGVELAANVGGSPKIAAEAFALSLVVESHLARRQKKQAVAAARAGLEALTAARDKKGIACGYAILAKAYIGKSSNDASHKEALQAINDAIGLVTETEDKRMELNLLHVLCETHLRDRNLEDALQAMDDAASLAQGLEDAEEEAVAMEAKCYALIRSRFDRDPERALQQATKAISLAQKAGNKVCEASAQLSAMSAKRLLEDYDGGLQAADQAQKLLEKSGYAYGRDCAMANVAESLADETKAINLAKSRVQLWSDIGNRKLEATAMNLLINMHLRMEDHGDAESVCLEAHEIWQEIEDATGETKCLLTLGEVYSAMANATEGKDVEQRSPECKEALENALDAANLAEAAATRARDRHLRASAHLLRGGLLSNHRGAVEACDAAYLMFKEAKDEAGEARCLTLRAYLHDNAGNPDKGLEVANEALEVAKESEDAQAEKEAEEAIAKIQASLKPKASAVQQQVIYVQQDAPQLAVQNMAQAAQSAVAVKVKAGLNPEQTMVKVKALVVDAIAMDDELETDSPLMESGMDSLASVAFMNEVAKEFKMQVSPALVFDFPTVRALTDHLVEESEK